MALRPGPGAGGAGGAGGGAAGAARSVVPGGQRARGCAEGGDKWENDDGELRGGEEGQSWREMGAMGGLAWGLGAQVGCEGRGVRAQAGCAGVLTGPGWVCGVSGMVRRVLGGMWGSQVWFVGSQVRSWVGVPGGVGVLSGELCGVLGRVCGSQVWYLRSGWNIRVPGKMWGPGGVGKQPR